jgi:hypothetical protein
MWIIQITKCEVSYIDAMCVVLLQLAMPGTGELSLVGSDGQLNITNNLQVIPGDIGDVRLGVSYPFDTPVYWKLPKQFLGDKVRNVMHFHLYKYRMFEKVTK